MEDYYSQTFNSAGTAEDWEAGVFKEGVLRGVFEKNLASYPEGDERDRMVEQVKAQAFIDGQDPLRVQEIYEEVLISAKRGEQTAEELEADTPAQTDLPTTEAGFSIARLVTRRLSRTEQQGARTPLKNEEDQ